ncbi:velvet factor domain-containing protein [Hirsutella rhossiliensis]|uniref:Velvet factor domain-containing protein n=1 Tax=Hirsutella rhossiliensis TaxID=111463 RepID=A0A9P8SEP5_9HYPO|nr:velvet factor domain-containing protein [Hirsutella rhossiliensis]KAH0958580.1 velvet factor domain-containing protein [Hirsutella rhossiliensis]
MASSTGSYLDMPFLQTGRHSSSLQYLGGGELPLAAEDSPPHHHAETYGDPQRQLTLRQAPMHARVAIGKEKDRKPIDPPPIVQLLDKRNNGKSGLYDSPYLFMTSSLVSENYGESSEKDQELPSNYLVGSLVSSIHRLRDTDNVEGGFFVFGDLSVKREGRFRLRFTLYERDQSSSSPSFYFVSELVTNVFTVFSTKLFPGMADSTQLTRTFSNQGVKVRLRKDSSGMAARKRNRGVADVTDEFLDRQTKRSSYDRELPLNNYAVSDLGHMDPLHGVVTTAPPTSFLVAADAMSSSSSSTPSRSAGLGMPLSTSGYYFTGAQYY